VGRGVTLAAILKHLAVLERAGLVHTEKSGACGAAAVTRKPVAT